MPMNANGEMRSGGTEKRAAAFDRHTSAANRAERDCDGGGGEASLKNSKMSCTSYGPVHRKDR